MLIVRSNQNAVMFKNENGTYSVYDVNTASYALRDRTLNACKKRWNKHYRNSRQYVTANGVNHRYLYNG